MGRKVLQPDGSYCWTENCRVHDRSLVDSVNKDAIIADAKNHIRAEEAVVITDLLKDVVPSVARKNIAGDILHDAGDMFASVSAGGWFSAGNIVDSVMQNIYGDSYDDEFDNINQDELFAVAEKVSSMFRKDYMVSPGDEVVIVSTGQRGHVTEGSNFLNGRVRVATEDEFGGGFDWHEGKDIVKVKLNTTGLARERFSSLPEDGMLSKENVKDLFDQESSLDTRNPQGVHGLSRKDAQAVREVFLEIGERFFKGYPGETVTKQRLARYVREESHKTYKWLPEQDAKNVKAGLNNLLAYINPVKHVKD
jgi:hypothetical protein